MTQTVTAAYDSELKAQNAFDERVSDGFPRESLFLDRQARQLKVIIGDSGQREVEEVLNRHEPAKLWSRPYEND